MNTPKLLFHGTCAVSVWASYRHALALVRTAKNDPEKARRYLEATKAQEYFSRFGPAYPNTYANDNNPTYPKVCLCSSLFYPLGFSTGWEKQIPDDWKIHLMNGNGRRLHLHCHPMTFGRDDVHSEIERPKELVEILHPLAKIDILFGTPGAILLIDGDFMKINNLLCPPRSGEEETTATYLPWRAIRGIFITYAENDFENNKIGGYIYRDNTVGQDIRDYLAVNPSPYLFNSQSNLP